MNKPSLFFSHSSKDSDAIIAIKDRLVTITGGTMEIFLSSDGQSIPLGRNWIHKIEEGLNKAAVMFIFVTPNSIVSNWIYFEAGFAYSKNIRVIPVGLHIDIAMLKPPLNILQGFNITSLDSLNNFIYVINNAFELNFNGQFIDSDYIKIEKLEIKSRSYFDFSEIFNKIYCELSENDRYKKIDNMSIMQSFYNGIVEYLDNNNIQHSKHINGHDHTNIILAPGVKINYHTSNIGLYEKEKIDFVVSPYNFEKSFCLFSSFVQLFQGIEWMSLNFRLKEGYEYIATDSDISAILSDYPDKFSLSKTDLGSFHYVKKDIRLRIKTLFFGLSSMTESVNILSVSFTPKDTIFHDISEVIESLIENKIIRQIQ